MSNPFHNMNIISIDAHDTAAKNRLKRSRNRRCSSRKKIFMAGGIVPFSLSEKNKADNDEASICRDELSSASSCQSSSSKNTDTSIKDGGKKEKNDHSSSTNNYWNKRITRTDLLHQQLSNKMKRLKEARKRKQSMFQPGLCVRTKHSEIALLEEKPPHDGARKRRIETFGIVLFQSTFFQRFWLIKFFNGKTKYCTEKVIQFCQRPVSRHGSSNCSNTINFDIHTDPRTHNEHVIMSYILHDKIFELPGHKDRSISSLAHTYFAKFPWVTARKLSNHLKLCSDGMKALFIPNEANVRQISSYSHQPCNAISPCKL